MADLDLTVVQARVATRAGLNADDADLVSATEAAQVIALDWTGRADTTPVSALPDDETTMRGMVGLSLRLLQNSEGSSPAGAGYDALYSPEALDRHWRHYFTHATVGYGVT